MSVRIGIRTESVNLEVGLTTLPGDTPSGSPDVRTALARCEVEPYRRFQNPRDIGDIPQRFWNAEAAEIVVRGVLHAWRIPHGS